MVVIRTDHQRTPENYNLVKVVAIIDPTTTIEQMMLKIARWRGLTKNQRTIQVRPRPMAI
jgi:hypothetical protein